jgi:hypothetical protein
LLALFAGQAILAVNTGGTSGTGHSRISAGYALGAGYALRALHWTGIYPCAGCLIPNKAMRWLGGKNHPKVPLHLAGSRQVGLSVDLALKSDA